jgi:hypothetical protein
VIGGTYWLGWQNGVGKKIPVNACWPQEIQAVGRYSDTAVKIDIQMSPNLKLVWNNPSYPDRQSNDLTMLRMLGSFLASATRCGYEEGAKRIAESHRLSPIAANVVTAQMAEAGLEQSVIRKIV